MFRYLSRPGLTLEVRNLTINRFEIGDGFMFHRGTNFDMYAQPPGLMWDLMERGRVTCRFLFPALCPPPYRRQLCERRRAVQLGLV